MKAYGNIGVRTTDDNQTEKYLIWSTYIAMKNISVTNDKTGKSYGKT